MRTWTWIVLVALLALGGYVVAGPHLTLRAIENAVAEDDTRALSRQVDFPALRASLKLQLDDRLVRSAGPEAQASPLGQLKLRLASGASAAAVDAMVTPVGLAAVMEGRRVWRRVGGQQPQRLEPDQERSGPLVNARWRYESPSRFTATVYDEAGRPLVFVLTRKRLRWRLSDIRLPPLPPASALD